MSPRRNQKATRRAKPVTLKYPGQHIARLMLWFPNGHRFTSHAIEGAIPKGLADLIMQIVSCPSPELQSAFCTAIAQACETAIVSVSAGLGVGLEAPPTRNASRSDRVVRQELTTKRGAGVIGRKA